ncbi:MAG: hypothetical protein J6W52_06220 [Bacteroidaceae bacterium]|nr:hypothetical protein [Bacteroidaceae bacterium]
MKRYLLLFAMVMATGICRAELTNGTEYFIWLNIYEKLLGSNDDGSEPALSAWNAAKASSYIFVAEDCGKSGYVLLKQKSSGKYLAASGSNAWSIVFEDASSTDDRFCWSADVGTYAYLTNKKNTGACMGVDGANKNSAYVSVYYDKSRSSHSQMTIIPATAGNYNTDRQSYVSAEYINAQGVREIDYVQVRGKTVNRSDTIDIHLTANTDPISGTSRIDLGSDRTWLIFDNIAPSKVRSDFLKYVRINGRTATSNNCRVEIYLNGTAIIPIPETIFTATAETPFTLGKGNHTDLAEYSNSMTGFTLRRGYMVTLATGRNGSGYSRTYVADHADLDITLPTALSRRVTSVYVKPWPYLSKKGWANTAGASGGPGLRATWFWAWNAAYSSTDDMEYVPCRQHLNWPSADDVNSHTSSAAFSLNEPEHSEQHTSDKCSCGGTIHEWNAYLLTKDFREGGGRVGSPQPTDLSYLTNYFKYVDQNDNETRCDFAVTHAYWWVGGKSASSYASWFVNQCKSIYNNTGRPVWLTEMEISASWNKSSGDKLDGDWSYANVAKYVQALLEKIDDSPWIERYAIYSTDMYITYMYYDANPSKDLTPAGEVYRDHRATFAYNSAYTKEPVWWTPGVKKPVLSATYDAGTKSLTFSIVNDNGDTTERLDLQRFNGTEWETLTTFDDRQQLEDKELSLTLSDFAATENCRFRLAAYTIFGGNSISDELEIGGIRNGTVVANSKTDIHGWTCVRSADNGFTKEASGDTYFEVWHPSASGISFDYYQDIMGLEDGIYCLSANVFQSGAADEAVALYGQTAEQLWTAPVMTDGSITDAPISVEKIAVTDGRLRVGVRNIAPMQARWAGADNFVLTRIGDAPSSDLEMLELMDEYDGIIMSVWPQNTDETLDASGMIINPQATGQREDGWTVQNVEFSKGEAYDSDASNPYFNYWSASSYTSSMAQTISGLPAGKYVLSALLRGSSSMSLTLAASTGKDNKRTKFTGTGTTASDDLPMGWKKVTVPAVSVGKGEVLTISLKASGTSWWSADNFQLTLVEPDVTGIGEIENSKFGMKDDAPVYDLSGYKLPSQALPKWRSGKGARIYIVNRKKILY